MYNMSHLLTDKWEKEKRRGTKAFVTYSEYSQYIGLARMVVVG